MAHHNERKIERLARMQECAERERQEARDRAGAQPVIDAYNARLKAGREPFFAPTIRAALITGHHWLIVLCRSCGTVIDLDLSMKPRPPEATVLMALRDVRCPRCNGHGRTEIMALAKVAGW